MLKLLYLARHVVLLLAASSAGMTGVIVSVSNGTPLDGGTSISSSQYARVTWSQNAEFTNITVSAWLFGDVIDGMYAPTTGSAYLTSAAGVFLKQSIVFPDPTVGKATDVVLFSGVDLGPGTYFLTLSADGFGGAWSDSANGGDAPIFIVGNGVNLGLSAFASPANLNASNPPGSTFSSAGMPQLFFSVTGDPLFSTSGDPVPEPRTGSALAVGLLIVFGAFRNPAVRKLFTR